MEEYQATDSPFHEQATESAMDLKVRAIKDTFVEKLRPIILEDTRIATANITHEPLSIYIAIELMTIPIESSSRKIQLWYDMDKHEFKEPKLEFDSFQISDGNMIGCNETVKNIVLGVMKKCYLVSQMRNLGTSKGGFFIIYSETPEIAAQKEWYRLEECAKKRIANDLRLREEQRKTDAEFMTSIKSGF